MESIKTGLIGWGTVGSGVVEILTKNKDLITNRIGIPLELRWVADQDLERPRPVSVPSHLLTRDAQVVLEDPQVQIVVELIGGLTAAKNFIVKALEKGKHVVTANKALLAHYGNELFSLAASKGRTIAFEASVAGGIPLIKVLREGLAANNIDTIVGILNGTCNFILTKMKETGITFEEALKEAQKLGYAEADPTLDIDGIDTAHKLAVATALAFNIPISFEHIYVEGIKHVDPLDIQFGEEFGYQLKLLAIGRHHSKGIELRVHPTFVPTPHVLASVRGAYNAVFVHGDAVGQTMFYGLGAGMMPTGSAVVADLMDVAKAINSGVESSALFMPKPSNPAPLLPMDEIVSSYYFRFMAIDRPGVLSKISGILGHHNISISAVIQKGRSSVDDSVPIVMVTHEAVERSVQQALKEIDNLDVVRAKTQIIRIEDFTYAS